MRASRAPTARPRRSRRERRLLVGVVTSGAVFLVSSVVASQGRPPEWEIAVFRAINSLPDWLYVGVWPFMQYGVFVTIPIAAVVAFLLGRRHLAGLLATGGVAIYVLARVVGLGRIYVGCPPPAGRHRRRRHGGGRRLHRHLPLRQAARCSKRVKVGHGKDGSTR